MINLEMLSETNVTEAGYKIVSYIEHRTGNVYDYIDDIHNKVNYPYYITINEELLKNNYPLLSPDMLEITL